MVWVGNTSIPFKIWGTSQIWNKAKSSGIRCWLHVFKILLIPLAWHNLRYMLELKINDVTLADTYINSLIPGDALWHLENLSTLVQVKAWCLTAPSHYLNHCWVIIINEVLRDSLEGILFIREYQNTVPILKTSLKFAPFWNYSDFRDQWVNLTHKSSSYSDMCFRNLDKSY